MGIREKIAGGASIIMIVAFVVYWGIQIQSALEMLRMAYPD